MWTQTNYSPGTLFRGCVSIWILNKDDIKKDEAHDMMDENDNTVDEYYNTKDESNNMKDEWYNINTMDKLNNIRVDERYNTRDELFNMTDNWEEKNGEAAATWLPRQFTRVENMFNPLLHNMLQ
jgi:hypothetical protein